VEIFSPARQFGAASWALKENLAGTALLEGVAAQKMDGGFSVSLPVGGLRPGFFDLEITLRDDGPAPVDVATTIGWRVDEITPEDTTPAGLAEFWQGVAADIRDTALDLHIEKIQVLRGREIDAYNRTQAGLPANYDPAGARCDEVEVGQISFTSPNGGRVHAWFAKPAGAGPFPGLLVLPGGGNNPRPAPVEHARHGWAAIDVQVHGLPVDYPYYPPLSVPSPARVEEHDGFPIYRNALAAVGALAALPGVDPGRLAACGGSQGGRLTVVVAALDHRIRAGVAAIAHYADVNRIAALKHGLSAPNFNDWFDIANFAPLVRCPMLLNAGLLDRISPPSSIQNLYLRLAGRREIVYLPNMGHDWSPVFDRKAWRWLSALLQ